jgi:hypothetical protein
MKREMGVKNSILIAAFFIKRKKRKNVEHWNNGTVERKNDGK